MWAAFQGVLLDRYGEPMPETRTRAACTVLTNKRAEWLHDNYSYCDSCASESHSRAEPARRKLEFAEEGREKHAVSVTPKPIFRRWPLRGLQHLEFPQS